MKKRNPHFCEVQAYVLAYIGSILKGVGDPECVVKVDDLDEDFAVFYGVIAPDASEYEEGDPEYLYILSLLSSLEEDICKEWPSLDASLVAFNLDGAVEFEVSGFEPDEEDWPDFDDDPPARKAKKRVLPAVSMTKSGAQPRCTCDDDDEVCSVVVEDEDESDVDDAQALLTGSISAKYADHDPSDSQLLDWANANHLAAVPVWGKKRKTGRTYSVYPVTPDDGEKDVIGEGPTLIAALRSAHKLCWYRLRNRGR